MGPLRIFQHNRREPQGRSRQRQVSRSNRITTQGLGGLPHAKTSIMSDLRKCPICKRELPKGVGAPAFGPFCSARCRSIDLGSWLDGSYRIPATPDENEDEDELPPDEEEGKG
jgi:uncharacterized protein